MCCLQEKEKKKAEGKDDSTPTSAAEEGCGVAAAPYIRPMSMEDMRMAMEKVSEGGQRGGGPGKMPSQPGVAGPSMA